MVPNVFPFFLGYLLLCLMLASFLILTSRKSPIGTASTGSKGIWWLVFLSTVLLFSLLCGYHFSHSKYTGFEILERALHFLFFIICIGTYFLFFGGFCQKRSAYDERHLHFLDAENYPMGDGMLLGLEVPANRSSSSSSRWFSRVTAGSRGHGHGHPVPILLTQQDIENMSITLDHLLFEGQMKPAPPPNYDDFAPPNYDVAMSNINTNRNTRAENSGVETESLLLQTSTSQNDHDNSPDPESDSDLVSVLVAAPSTSTSKSVDISENDENPQQQSSSDLVTTEQVTKQA